MNEHPNLPAAMRAVGFMNEGKFFEAEALFRQLTQANSAYPLAVYEYGCFKLLTGDYEGAWPLFQRRLDDEVFKSKGTMQLPQPFWDGRPAPDKTLMVHIDQGIGDAILCARYIPAAADLVGDLIFAVHTKKGRFFSSVDPRIQIVEVGDPVPEFDIHIDVFSLPVFFDAAPGNIPKPPYLFAEPQLVAKWRDRLAGPEFKVGLAWQGNPDHVRDAERSMKLIEMVPLMEVPGSQFYGLQIGVGAEQAWDLPADLPFESLEDDLKDSNDNMVDEAAVVENLDLVISIDSAIANLAAAMGKPTWVPTPKIPDWRWLIVTGTEPLTYADGPWYPKARVFPTPVRFEWTQTVSAMTEALAAEAGRAAG